MTSCYASILWLWDLGAFAVAPDSSSRAGRWTDYQQYGIFGSCILHVLGPGLYFTVTVISVNGAACAVDELADLSNRETVIRY